MKVALFIYPFDITAGFLMGGMSGSGRSVDALLQLHVIQVALVIAIAMLTPLSYYLSRYLFTIFFGRHLQQLDEMITQLSEE